MKRRKFLGLAGSALLVSGGVYYGLSDKSNLTRDNIKTVPAGKITFKADEREILYQASLAPSGHNTQPWFVKYMEPYHWIIGNDQSKWLPGVDPTQRETILSIGTFLQNLEYAASHYGYSCQWNMLATTRQDANIMEVKLKKTSNLPGYELLKIKSRRTVRNNMQKDIISNEDLNYLTREDLNNLHFIANRTKEYQLINEQTIEANRLQMYRDAAEEELANWIRFSGKDAEKYRDGLTTASMELEGLSAWYVRNFYGKATVMKKSFRETGIDNVKKQVAASGGWLIITGNDDSVAGLLDTGRRMQRLFLKVRDKGIAMHPMTQILEEPTTNQTINPSIGINEKIQFILRIGYVKKYPDPDSLRRPVDWFIHT